MTILDEDPSDHHTTFEATMDVLEFLDLAEKLMVAARKALVDEHGPF